LISWKYSLEKINGELDLARKKKQVLDKLLSDGKVSQPTYASFTNEITDAITEIELKQKALAEKMKAKTSELEQQIKTLEHLLVNSEIRHVSGETDDDAYNNECSILSLGLDTTRRELSEIADAITNLSDPNPEAASDSPPPDPDAPEPDAAEPADPEPEKRLEIIMDTETTTTIESTVEERTVDAAPDTPPEPDTAPEPEPEPEEPPAAAEPAEEPTSTEDEPTLIEIVDDDTADPT
jgi:chromosome segregation ATPase